MKPKEAIGQAERRFLQAVAELAAEEPEAAVSFTEVQEFLAYSDSQAEACCDFWTRRGAVEWPVRGHLALTRAGLVWLERLRDSGSISSRRPHWWPVGACPR